MYIIMCNNTIRRVILTETGIIFTTVMETDSKITDQHIS